MLRREKLLGCPASRLHFKVILVVLAVWVVWVVLVIPLRSILSSDGRVQPLGEVEAPDTLDLEGDASILLDEVGGLLRNGHFYLGRFVLLQGLVINVLMRV